MLGLQTAPTLFSLSLKGAAQSHHRTVNGCKMCIPATLKTEHVQEMRLLQLKEPLKILLVFS